MRKRRVLMAAVAAAVLSTTSLFAQAVTSTITGRLSDPTGAVIPGAKVTVINQNSGVKYEGQSNEVGLYHIGPLSPGTYRIEVEATGFQHLVRKGVTVQVSDTVTVDLAIQVGNVSETVTVTGAASIIESQTSSVGQLVERSMIESMPLPNRSAAAMITLSPGAAVINPGSGGENLPLFAVGGGRARNQQFSLDGGNVTNITGLAVPQNQAALPMDAMQEFRVISNNYAAEHGHSTGGVITMVTKAGTNDFHGSLFEYARNDAFDARNFYSAAKPMLRLHQFGGSAGGPIRKDKTHFFASWEQTRQVTGGTAIQSVPSPAQRSGDFSDTRNAAGNVIPIYDPETTANGVRQPFPGNRIPTNRIDPVAKAVTAYWPQPNRPASITGANNFLGNTRPEFTRNIVVARVDHQFRPTDQVTVRYYINDNDTQNPGPRGTPESDSGAVLSNNQNSSILAAHTHTFSPRVVQEFRFTRLRRFGGSQAYGRGKDYAAKIGLKGVSGEAFPIFNIPGFAALGREPFRINSAPQYDDQYQDSVSYYRGDHAFKFGGEYRRGSFNDNHDVSSSGNFSFTPLITGQPGVGTSGNAFASFLLGEVNAASTVRADEINSRAGYWALYAQDDYRVTDRLTLNLGLRWEVSLPRWDVKDRMNAFDRNAINPVSGTPGIVTFAGRNGLPRTAFDSNYHDFGPRVGFAWRVPGLQSTVIRGGGGIFYGEIVSNIIGTAAALGFSTDVSLVATQAGLNSAMRLREGFPAGAPGSNDQLGPGYGAVHVGDRATTAVTFFERNRPTPVSYQYNLNVQHELRSNFLVEAGYVANISHHLTGNDLTINQVPAALMGPGNAQLLRPYPQFSNVSMINPPVGNSTYHALVLKAEKRYSAGLTFLAHYTFSKFIDDVAAFSEYGSVGSYMDAYRRGLDKGISGNDIRHRALASAVYELPFLKDHRGALGVLGGWKTGAIATLQSGPPFTVYNLSDTTNAFPAGGLRPDLTGDPFLSGGERSIQRWFNTGAFHAPLPYRFGTSPRSVLRGPGAINVDLSLLKIFTITERFKAEFRGEFFNFPNHANFGMPGGTLNGPNFGVINSARDARTVQLGLRVSF